MKSKKIYVLLASLVMASSLTACSGSSSALEKTSSQATAAEKKTTADKNNEKTETTTDKPQKPTEKLIPPSPVEASDPNSVTFDDGNFDFITIQDSNIDSAKGKLSIVEIKGNKMLKFTDDLSVPIDGKVQKLIVSASKLLDAKDLPKVRSIQFDLYADATAKNYTNKDGKKVKAPGTICGGGGTVTAKTDSKGKGKWYDFESFEGGEYNFDMSGAVHAEFKFLLAAGGLTWDEKMEDANFLIMRWGSENDSNLYLDNIVFYDENGNSLPVNTEKNPKETGKADKKAE